MRKRHSLRLISVPVLAAMLTAPMLSGCGESDDLTESVAGECAAELSAKADAFQVSVQALVTAAGEMKTSLAMACYHIADDLGDDSVTEPENEGEGISDEDMQALCTAAAGAIEAEISASGSIALEYVPPRCTVSAEAQLNCEANCSVDAECEGGTIEARCDPGELRVTCEGTCEGTASCEGTADVAAACEGSCAAECTGECEGTCSGTCSGTCTGECDGTCSAENAEGQCEGTCEGTCRGTCDAECQGSCSGTCTGTCTGSCEYTAEATVECDAELTCTGGCEGTATAPSCEAELQPPSCDIDAECQAGCDGQAKFEAECTEPRVTITGTANAEFAATLEAQMPAILSVVAKLELIGEAAGQVAADAEDLGVELTGSASCALAYGADFVAQLQAAATASMSVEASFSASAEVSGSASGSGEAS